MAEFTAGTERVKAALQCDLKEKKRQKKAISFMSRDSLFSGHSSGLREVPFL